MHPRTKEQLTGLNPANYSLAQVKVAVTALVVAAISIAGFFIAFDPGFQAAAVVVVGEIFAVVGAFAAKEVTYDSIAKTVAALAGGVIALVGFFVPGGVDPGTTATILGIVSQVVLVVGVLVTQNVPGAEAPPQPGTPA